MSFLETLDLSHNNLRDLDKLLLYLEKFSFLHTLNLKAIKLCRFGVVLIAALSLLAAPKTSDGLLSPNLTSRSLRTRDADDECQHRR